MPKNPFNEKLEVKVLADGENFPADANGQVGWIYKPYTKEIKLDWPRTDSQGIHYFDY